MVKDRPVDKAIATIVTMALLFASLIAFSSPAQAVSNTEGSTIYQTTFYAYLNKGERLLIEETGPQGVTILNEAGATVTVGSNKYTPVAANDGVWRVTLRGSFSYDPKGFAYNFSVRAGTTEKTGRVWVLTDTILHNQVGNLDYFGVSDLGYIYQIKMDQVRPINATIALRSSGAAPTNKCNVQNKSIDGGGYLNCGDQYKLFFEDPRKSGMPEEAKMGNSTIPLMPPPVTTAQLKASTKVAFKPSPDSVGGSFTVSSYVTFSGTADLQIDTNNNGSYTDAVDITETVVVNGGKSEPWEWDGKDAKGKDVTAGAKARVVIDKSGEAHLFVTDFEAFGGLTMTRLNGESPNSIIYWDDSALLKPKGSTTPVKVCLNGCNSNVKGGIHGWAEGKALSPEDTESRSWGDGRVIDNWAYVAVNATSPVIALPAVHTLTFDTQGGVLTGPKTITRPHGTAWGTLPTSKKYQHDYAGWYSTPTGGGTKFETSTLATSSTTAYARHRLIQWNLTFDATTNGGVLQGVKTIKETHDNPWGPLPTATKANHTFVGWFSRVSGGNETTAASKAGGDLTVYAQFKIIERRMTFDANGGTNNGAAFIARPHGAEWGDLVTRITASRANHDFQGWYTAKTGGTQVTSTTLVTKDLTVYAQWKLTPRTLTFDANGGKVNGAGTVTVPHGSPWGTLSTATLANYDFQGWYTAKSGGTQVTAATVSAGNITVYAQWKLTPRTITFDPTGGTVTGVKTITKPHGSAWGTLPSATAPAKVFLGWYTAKTGGNQITATTVATGDITAYAQWRPSKFSVVFYGNAQTGKITGQTPSMNVDSGCTDCRLTPNGFTKTTGALEMIEEGSTEKTEVNSKFLGWSLDPMSQTGQIADRAIAGGLSQTDGATVKLYAIWDDAPRFVIESYPHRFFNLEQAKSGAVTEAELLRTVKATDKETIPLEKKTSAQVLSSGNDVGITLYDYDAKDYTALTDSGVITATYKVKDAAQHVAFLRIRVTVSNGDVIGSVSDTYLRGIAPRFVNEAPNEGGLSQESLWRTDPVRQAALDAALNGTSFSAYCLKPEAIESLRQQVKTDGLGNSVNPGSLATSAQTLRDQGVCE